MSDEDPYPVIGSAAIKMLEQKFEDEYQHWNEKHNLAPDYPKGQGMRRPKMRHIQCITRAQHLLETGINVADNPSLKKSIQGDIELLCEIRQILHDVKDNPTLPFLNQIEEEPNAGI